MALPNFATSDCLFAVGNHVFFDTVERHCVFQQIVGSIDVSGADTNVVNFKADPCSRHFDHNVECGRRYYCFVNMPTAGEELELYVTGNLR